MVKATLSNLHIHAYPVRSTLMCCKSVCLFTDLKIYYYYYYYYYLLQLGFHPVAVVLTLVQTIQMEI
jgi:hypothetical protein